MARTDFLRLTFGRLFGWIICWLFGILTNSGLILLYFAHKSPFPVNVYQKTNTIVGLNICNIMRKSWVRARYQKYICVCFFNKCPIWTFEKFQKGHIYLCNSITQSIFIFHISVIFHQEHIKCQYSMRSTFTILHPTDLLSR